MEKSQGARKSPVELERVEKGLEEHRARVIQDTGLSANVIPDTVTKITKHDNFQIIYLITVLMLVLSITLLYQMGYTNRVTQVIFWMTKSRIDAASIQRTQTMMSMNLQGKGGEDALLTVNEADRLKLENCLAEKNIVVLPHEFLLKEGEDKMMSMRQTGSHPIGFPTKCDIIYGSRKPLAPYKAEKYIWVRDASERPWQTVFSKAENLQSFVDNVLPCLPYKFVLISGDSDRTVPKQTDLRHPTWGPHIDMQAWKKLHDDDKMVHHFAENLDTAWKKTSPLPLGLNPHEYTPNTILKLLPRATENDGNNPLTVLDTSRVRPGNQWVDRQVVRNLCRTLDFCHTKIDTPTGEEYLRVVQNRTFLLCPHGGGLDPSPKAWEALALGTIPIIKRYEDDSAYRELPVVMVDEWSNKTITFENLQRWRNKLMPFYTDRILREKVLYKLSMTFWWSKVEAKLQALELPIEELFVE